MSDLCLLAASLLTHSQKNTHLLPSTVDLSSMVQANALRSESCSADKTTGISTAETSAPEFSAAPGFPPAAIPAPPPTSHADQVSVPSNLQPRTLQPAPQPVPLPVTTPVSIPALDLQPVPLRTPRPVSGSQLYQQRITALRAGRTYTRLPANSFWDAWVHATQQPTYEQWIHLLSQEARAMAQGQGTNRLTVLVGDSLSLWYPSEQLSSDRFWLNQGISGDTTTGVLRRLSAFAHTHPDTIHLMVGINDLRQGATDQQVITNLQQIMRRLRQQHPQARIHVYSILPTRLPLIPGSRIRQINQSLGAIAKQEQVQFLDVVDSFADAQGNLRYDLTTDGLHLNARGYATWQLAMADRG